MRRLLLTIIACCFSLSVFAQGRQAAPAKPSPAPAAAAPAANDETAPEASAAGSTSGASFTIGGGYFMPQADMAVIFKPSWCVKLSARNNNMSGTLFGLGCDLSYTTLKDKDFSSGRMTYGTLFPHVTAAFSLFGLFDVVGKGGAGLSSITSKVRGESNGSVSLTLGAGGGIARVFGKKFIIGLETDYLYYMQRSSSKSLSAYMYMGYKM